MKVTKHISSIEGRLHNFCCVLFKNWAKPTTTLYQLPTIWRIGALAVHLYALFITSVINL